MLQLGYVISFQICDCCLQQKARYIEVLCTYEIKELVV